MTPTQAQDLKRLAEAATPGPWTIVENDYGDEHWFGGSGDGQVFVNGFVSGGCKRNPKKWAQLKADAAYISAMSPDVALQLLADRAMLLKLLEEATDDAEYYCQYAGEYLVDKHGIKDRIAEYRAAIKQCEQGEQP